MDESNTSQKPDGVLEEETVGEEEHGEESPEEETINWGFDKGEKIFKVKKLRFKPFTTSVSELEKYGDAIALTGNLYTKQFIEHITEGIWRMRYYEKPFPEYYVQGQFLEGITTIEMTDVDVNYDLIYHVVENEKVFRRIKLLRFRNCNMMDEQLKILCPKLGIANALSELDLSHNPIGDEGLKVIVKYLNDCPLLRTLNLFDTEITPKGLDKLAHLYAKQHIRLTKLNIGRNRLTSPNSIKRFLGGIVKKSAPLQDLIMANCSLQGAEMAANFETTLSLSENIRYLDISFNLFSTEEELLSIITLFARSTSLREMVLNFNPICDSVLTTTLECLFEYPKLEPNKNLYIENITLPQVFFKDKWNSFNRNDLKITSAGVRKIKVPVSDSFKVKLVKRFNFLYRKKKTKKDMVLSTLKEYLQGKNLKRVKVDDFQDALMAVGKMDILLIQEITNEFAGGGSRANVQEFMDIYNELYPPKPKVIKKAGGEKKKKKKNSTD